LLERARTRALGLAYPLTGSAAETIAAVSFAGDLLGGLWLERNWAPTDLTRVLDRITPLVGDPDLALLAVFSRAARSDDLLELPPRLAIETELRMLLVFGGLTHASLWRTEGRKVECVARAGDEELGRPLRTAARRALTEGPKLAPPPRSAVRAVAITRWDTTQAALVMRMAGASQEVVSALAAEAGGVIGQLLELDGLLARHGDRERSLVESSERRLVRVGFDLHDGPMQDLIALMQELDLFRAQLTGVVRGDDGRLIIGRVSDIEARIRTVDRDLREIAKSLNAPVLLRTSLAELLESELAAFEKRAKIKTSLHTTGNLDELTSSARVALLRLVQEALANVANHARASHAGVTVAVGRGHVRVAVEDDGVGFDVESELVRAARGGRMGLVGMGERIRLLGGRFDVRSAPGGPTVVTASFPRWRPLDGEALAAS
jgi:signal transduction histidine kinase